MVFGQEIVFEKELVMKAFIKDDRESFPIVNYEKNEIALFLFDNTEIQALRFNMDYELTDEYSTTNPRYYRLLGHSIDKTGYQLFYANGESTEFCSQYIDIVGKTSSDLKVLVTLEENEKYIESISYNDQFYLLTCMEGTSVLHMYAFEGDSLVTTKELNFSAYKFSSKRKADLYNALLTKSGFATIEELKIQKIDINNPNTIDLVTSKNKLYYYDNKIHLSIDNELENTKLITFDLKDFSTKMAIYNQVTVDCEKAIIVQSNSYLYRDKLYQIKGCYLGMGFQVVNIERDSIVKVLSVKEDEEINFSNTPLILEDLKSGSVREDTQRELNSTKQFLKRIADSQIGIVAHQINNEILLTIGGYTKLQNAIMAPGASPGLSVSSTYHYNQSMYAFSIYNDSRAVYFSSKFDSKEYKHIEGKVPENSYDRIKTFKNANENSGLKSLTVFRVNNYYIIGYYNKLDKKYYLRRFTV
jgi:hypothetical protein